VPFGKQIFNTFGERLGYRSGGHSPLTTPRPFVIRLQNEAQAVMSPRRTPRHREVNRKHQRGCIQRRFRDLFLGQDRTSRMKCTNAYVLEKWGRPILDQSREAGYLRIDFPG
jgi:hypothetical protein